MANGSAAENRVVPIPCQSKEPRQPLLRDLVPSPLFFQPQSQFGVAEGGEIGAKIDRTHFHEASPAWVVRDGGEPSLRSSHFSRARIISISRRRRAFFSLQLSKSQQQSPVQSAPPPLRVQIDRVTNKTPSAKTAANGHANPIPIKAASKSFPPKVAAIFILNKARNAKENPARPRQPRAARSLRRCLRSSR